MDQTWTFNFNRMGIRARPVQNCLAGAILVVVLAGLTEEKLAQATSLNEALVNAYLTNPDLEGERARARSNDEVVNQALSGYLPDVFLRGRLNSTTGQSSTRDLDQSSASASLTFTQNLYAGGNTRALVRQAESLVQSDRSDLVAIEQNVFTGVVEAYTAVWRDRSVLDLALNNQRRLQQQLEATELRQEVGELARTDVEQAKARLARGRADVETARANLAASRAQYVAVVGAEPGELQAPEVLESLPATLAEAQLIAERNPEIEAQIFDVDAQRHAIDARYAGLLPSLDLNGSVALERRSSGNEDSLRTGTIGLDLAIPLYQGGRVRSEVRQQRQLLARERSQLQTIERVVRREVDTSWGQLLAEGSARRSFETEIRANEVALEGVNAQEQQGLRTILDVLDAQQELFESQVNFVIARRDEVVASYRLKAAVGMLTIDGLELEVEPYNPTAYAEQTRIRLFGLDELAEKIDF